MEVYPEEGQRKIWRDKAGKIIRINGIAVQAAVMASEKGHPFFAEVLDFYSNKRFNFRTKKYFMDFVTTTIQSQILLKYGFRFVDKQQNLEEGITIYPSTLFESGPEQIMSESYGTHLCLGGWRSQKNLLDKIIYKIKRLTYIVYKLACRR